MTTKQFDIISCQTDELIETIDDEELTLYRHAGQLLEALELALEHLAYDGKHPAVVSAKKAIAKAKGE